MEIFRHYVTKDGKQGRADKYNVNSFSALPMVIAQADIYRYNTDILVNWVCNVRTHPKFRKQGLATKLLLKICEEADAEKIALKLNCVEEMQGFYRRFHFNTIEYRAPFYTMLRLFSHPLVSQ